MKINAINYEWQNAQTFQIWPIGGPVGYLAAARHFPPAFLIKQTKQGDNRHGRDSGERGKQIITRAFERQVYL